MLLKHITDNITCIKSAFVKAAIVVSIIIVASCTTPTKPGISVTEDSLSSLMDAAALAAQESSPQKDQQLLSITQRLQLIGQTIEAENLLKRIDFTQLSSDDLTHYFVSASDIFLINQSLSDGKSLLSISTIDTTMAQASIEQQKQFYRNSAQLYQLIGEIGMSVKQLVILGTLLSETTETQANNDSIWQQVSSLSYKELIRLSSSTSDRVFRGWLDLARSSNQSQNSLTAQNTAINNWLDSHATHPASQQLPSNLRALQNLIIARPNHIALLLPLQGKLARAGESIRDGFLAAYYNSKQDQHNAPKITLYDTSIGNIQHIYDQAVNDGVDLVIGPLSKENVAELHQKATLAKPILALNYIDNTLTDNVLTDNSSTNSPPSNTQTQATFYQFGLSLEDEAIQVAERAWAEGHRHALIISSPADWSQRSSRAFTERWLSLGGVISDDTTLDSAETYADIIEKTLLIDQSKQRASQLKRLFGRNFEFEPRRRHDIDMVFLVTRSQEGTQIKPTLNFYYASDIPVYATSQLYSKANSKSKNIDLNKIRLTVMPWLIQENITEKELINKNIKNTAGYEKLYALGVDSFLLYPRLQQLFHMNNLQLYGATGQLSISNDNRIYRKQLWAEIADGELKELNSLHLTSDDILE